jgi:hypothetical protein
VREPLPSLLSAVEALPPEDVPAALGILERARAYLWARLHAPRPPEAQDGAPRPTDGRLLTVEEVATQLRTSPRWVYRHRRALGGKKLGAKVRFTEGGLQRYLAGKQ